MTKKPYRTEKQRRIMALLFARVSAGQPFYTVGELHDALADGATYGATRMSVKALEEGGMLMLEPEGVAKRVVPTQRGYEWFAPVAGL